MEWLPRNDYLRNELRPGFNDDVRERSQSVPRQDGVAVGSLGLPPEGDLNDTENGEKYVCFLNWIV